MSHRIAAEKRAVEHASTGIRSADDALRYHIDLFSTFGGSPASRVAGLSQLDSVLRYAATKSPGDNESSHADFLEWMINHEMHLLTQGETIFVSAEIMDEITEASSTMLDSVLIEQDLFTPVGLIVLEKPFLHWVHPVDSDLGEYWMIKAIGYELDAGKADGENGINVFLYGNIDYLHYKDTNESALVYHDRVTIVGDFSSEVQLSQKNVDDGKMEFFMQMASGRGRFADWTRFNFGHEDESSYSGNILALKKFLLSYFRLSFEYLERNKVFGHRTARRAAHRENLQHNGYIVEMRLRRTENGEKLGGTHSSPAYAFRVRGHWKRAYMRSRGFAVGDPAAYRHIYVKDYIKGRGDIVESHRVLRVEK